MRTLILLVVLVPTIGMVAVATAAASTAAAKRDASARMQAEADVLAEIVDARVALGGEESQSAVVSVAADLGVGIDQISELYDIDYRAELRDARALVDADPTLDAVPDLAAGLERLRSTRDAVDAESATFLEVRAVFAELIAGLDDVWRERFERLGAELRAEDLPGTLHEHTSTVRATFEALSWSGDRIYPAIQLLRVGPDPAVLADLLDATTRQRAAVDDFAGLLGPEAAAVWEAHVVDPVTVGFERTLDEVAEAYLTGTASPLATDPAAFGAAFVDAQPWAAGLSRLAQAAAADLRGEAARQERAATGALQMQVVVAALLGVLAVAGALALARNVTGPARRLEAAAHQIHSGRFDLDPIETSGPRELSDTASAFNEMAATLASVESHAVALADDPDAPFLDEQLPGRTGRALQVALNRLRASIRSAEQHRRELERAATHDGLTGLLNRTAAITMIERELARSSREGSVVMALFVDLDGLKPINDEHGHAAGDDAIRLTADALRASTRQSDVVARVGGDEFIVAGVVDEGRAEVEALAGRVHQAVGALELAGPAGGIPLHCSIGMAVSGPGVETVDALIQRADAAMYLAKQQGRGRLAWDDHHDHRDTTGTSTGQT